MKGTIYLWVLAAVLSGALVGLLGFVIEGVFSLQSSFMEPVIIGAIAGVVPGPINIYLFRKWKRDFPPRTLPQTTPRVFTPYPVASRLPPPSGTSKIRSPLVQ